MSDPWEVEAHALSVLSALYREVVRSAWPLVLAYLRDATPRVQVTGRRSGVVVDVRVDDDGKEFVFRPSLRRHSTADVSGAAGAVLALVCASDEPASILNSGGGRG